MKQALILPAVLATVLAGGWPACAEIVKKGPLLQGPEIAAALNGMTMTGNYGNGVKYTETYHPDGTITYTDDDGSDTGRWFIRDDLFCTFYDTYDGACYAVRKSGPNCYEYYTEQEEDGSSHPYEGAWNSVGWDITRDSTCDLSDKTS